MDFIALMSLSISKAFYGCQNISKYYHSNTKAWIGGGGGGDET